MNKLLASLLAAAVLAAPTVAAAQADARIGFVNTQRIMREAAPAVKAQKRIDQEFSKRDQDLQRLAKQLQSMQESLEKGGASLSEAERRNKERDFNELNRDFQRKQREFREDLNLRQNEEMAAILERANKAIKQIAEAEKYDIILQDAVWANPRIDLTEKVIKALADK